MSPVLYVATNGLSLWYSEDLGESLLRTHTDSGLYSGSQVWAVACHPANDGEMLLGCEQGVYRRRPGTTQWEHVTSPLDGKAAMSPPQTPQAKSPRRSISPGKRCPA